MKRENVNVLLAQCVRIDEMRARHIEGTCRYLGVEVGSMVRLYNWVRAFINKLIGS